MEDYFTRRQQPDEKTFPQLQELGEDIILHVLSFVAAAPFENPEKRGVDNYMSALTHSLPLVSKQFHRLTKSEELWRVALTRQVAREPDLWRRGLLELRPQSEGEREPENTQLLEAFSGTTSQELYRQCLNTQIRQTKYIFCMHQRLKLGEPYGLHFFEPRYRLLIAEVMRDFPIEAKQGGPIVPRPGQKPPTFIHAHVHPLRRGTPACLVQVIGCRIAGDGRADVFLKPIKHVFVECMWDTPNSGHLYIGQCLQAGHEESERLDRAASEPHIFGYY